MAEAAIGALRCFKFVNDSKFRLNHRHKNKLRDALANDGKDRRYETVHRLLAEGSFVLSVTEGHLDGEHVSFYDLFRLADGKVVEHWDTIDEVPPRSEWVNDNGKF